MEPFCELKSFFKPFNLDLVEWSIIQTALTHKSYIHENHEIQNHSERLEFLGDSVLSLLITKKLFVLYPKTSEGDLSKLRSTIVNESKLSYLCDQMCLTPFIRLGKGEKGNVKKSIKADAFEALLGAIYLCAGFEVVEKFWDEVILKFDHQIYELKQLDGFDAKSKLQEYCLGLWKKLPEYKSEEVLKGKNSIFRVTLSIENYPLLSVEYFSKKKAELILAEDCLKFNLHTIPKKGDLHAST
jgi:ribonuclease-3